MRESTVTIIKPFRKYLSAFILILSKVLLDKKGPTLDKSKSQRIHLIPAPYLASTLLTNKLTTVPTINNNDFGWKRKRGYDETIIATKLAYKPI